jgi:hypothetical protein
MIGACRSAVPKAAPDTSALNRLSFAETDTGCFELKPVGHMIKYDSELVLRVGIVRIDTERFGTYAGLRRIEIGPGLGPAYTTNIWSRDSLSDSVRWYLGHFYGGVEFRLGRSQSVFAGSAIAHGDAVPTVRYMGPVVANRARCRDRGNSGVLHPSVK